MAVFGELHEAVGVIGGRTSPFIWRAFRSKGEVSCAVFLDTALSGALVFRGSTTVRGKREQDRIRHQGCARWGATGMIRMLKAVWLWYRDAHSFV